MLKLKIIKAKSIKETYKKGEKEAEEICKKLFWW